VSELEPGGANARGDRPPRARIGSRHGSSALRSRLPTDQQAAMGERFQDVNRSVSSLHLFVELVDRVRTQRLRGLCLLVALNVGDVGTTVWFLARGGTEGNPVLAPIVHRWWLLVMVKVVVLAILSKGVLAAPPRSASARRLILVAVLYYSVVLAWNLRVIGRL
jgi:Domain of unknown function (DUF5658)